MNQVPRIRLTTAMLVLLPFLALACAEKKQIKDTHESTQEVNKTTKEILEISQKNKQQAAELTVQSQEIKAATQDLSQRSAEIKAQMQALNEKAAQTEALQYDAYDEVRAKAATQKRRDSLLALLEAKSFDKKRYEAAAYLVSFEYQLWLGFGVDASPEKRNLFLARAVTQFMADLKEVIGESRDIDPFTDENKATSFNALAVELQQIGTKQKEVLQKRPEVESMSMLRTFEEALSVEKDLNEGRLSLQSLPESTREVLNQKSLVVELLQARHNVMGVLFLEKVLPREGFFAQVRAGMSRFVSWNFKMDSYNLSQLSLLADYLNEAIRLRTLLKRNSIEPLIHDKLNAFVQNMTPVTSVQGSKELQAKRTQLIALIQEMKK